jgi:hypothetical protein
MIVRVYDSSKRSFHSSALDMSSEQAERFCMTDEFMVGFSKGNRES